MSVEPSIVTPTRRICTGRDYARELIASRPNASPGMAVYVKLDEVEAVSPPFVDELLKAWPLAEPIGANGDVRLTWDFVTASRQEVRGDG